jgi:VanZ family protein
VIKQTLIIFLFYVLPALLPAQDSVKSPLPASQSIQPDTSIHPVSTTTSSFPPNKKRIWLVAGGHAAIWAVSYIALNQAWYADYPKEDFHFFNDWNEWNQMDKAGHVWTAYQLSRFSTEAWRWTGLKKSTSIWIGSASAVAYQSIIEIQDGFSSQWGFSWGDMVANVAGAAGLSRHRN